MKRMASLLSVVVLLSVAVPALADVTLYTNGPINGTITAFRMGVVGTISNSISSSFTLSTPADVETMSLGIWANSGQTPATLEFGISATPFGTDLASGTATLSNVFHNSNTLGVGFDVYDSSFSFPSVDLAPGTYYITLSHAASNTGVTLNWDQNDGVGGQGPPSLAFQNGIGHPINSLAFSMDGTVIPEPGTLMMLGTGIFGMAGTIRRKRL